MSNEAIHSMQKALDVERRKNQDITAQVQQLLADKEQLIDLNTGLVGAEEKHVAELNRAKSEGTVRAKEQIEALTAENEQLKKDAVANAELLQQTGEECKELVQRVLQAETHMKQMAAEHQAPKPERTFRKDRIRKSQR